MASEELKTGLGDGTVSAPDEAVVSPLELQDKAGWDYAFAIEAVIEQARKIANGTLPQAADVTRLRFLLREMDAKIPGPGPVPQVSEGTEILSVKVPR